MAKEPRTKETKTIQSIERGFAMLELLSLEGKPLSLQEISQSLALSKSTAHGILATMSNLGYIERSKTRLQSRPSVEGVIQTA